MFSLLPRNREKTSVVQPGSTRIVRPELSFFSWVDDMFNQWAESFSTDLQNFRDTSRDYTENESAITIRIDAPGFEPSDFNIEVKENGLRVTAERKVQKDDKTHYVERKLTRVYELPVPVNAEKVEASYRNGVLEIHLPKTEQLKWRKVAIAAN
ncbi:MAG: Hsp20/alpha crystallin family protein [Gemmataceae bacterium]|jgi:HSP20 family molecular chaperone IbpA|nr:Hsp20/alpha crystallin family protein [Gemmataceae bacterium]